MDYWQIWFSGFYWFSVFYPFYQFSGFYWVTVFYWFSELYWFSVGFTGFLFLTQNLGTQNPGNSKSRKLKIWEYQNLGISKSGKLKILIAEE